MSEMDLLLILVVVLIIFVTILLLFCCVLSGRQSRLDERRQLRSLISQSLPVPPSVDHDQ